MNHAGDKFGVILGRCFFFSQQVKWSVVASRLPGRIGKQCRERWFNHLDPSIKKGEWSPEEDRIVFGAQVSIPMINIAIACTCMQIVLYFLLAV